MRPSPALQIALRPREMYARLTPPSGVYLLQYLAFVAVLIGTVAAISATGRVTLELLGSLSLAWLVFPIAHVAIALAVSGGAPARRTSRARAAALLLQGHAPWSIWLIAAAVMIATGGYAAYRTLPWLAVVPFALTARILYAFAREVLGLNATAAAWRVVAHQCLTWLLAVLYIEKAVGLTPRLLEWLQ